MNDIGGNVCIRDGDRIDYCWRESVRSLLPICDSVTVCDGGSTDGTLEAIQEWAKTEPKIRLVQFPWQNPERDGDFWVKWLNWSREQIPHFWHLQLDADEVLFSDGYGWIDDFTKTKRKQSAIMLRLNFWRDSRHLVPHNHACGFHVIRLGPQSLWMPSDSPHPLGADLCDVSVPSPVKIGHYGFLRRRTAYFEKLRRWQHWAAGSYDPRLITAEASRDYLGTIAKDSGWDHLVEEYSGNHPDIIRPWLTERGYTS